MLNIVSLINDNKGTNRLQLRQKCSLLVFVLYRFNWISVKIEFHQSRK